MKKTNKLVTIILIAALIFAIWLGEDLLTDGDGQGDFEVHFIDVGQGDSILIKDNEEYMLIDAGKKSDANLVIEYLRNQNVKRLKYLIGTHPHDDHIGGLSQVIETFEIGHVIMPNVTHTTRTFEELLNSIKNKNLTITPARSGDRHYLDKAEILILAPNQEEYSNLNNYSVVTKIKYEGTSFIFTGDAERMSEREIIERYPHDLKADILKLGHHGSNTSTSQEFLDAVDPSAVVITVGENNTYRHPDKEVLERLEEKDIQIHRTDLEGHIIVKSNGKTLTFNDGSSVKGTMNVLLRELYRIKDMLMDSLFGEEYELEVM